MAKQYDLVVRLLLLGDSGVGKTCMVRRFAEDTFYNDAYVSTIGIDFRVKNVKLEGKSVKIQIWDTAGQERYDTITKQYYRRAQGIFIVYDITNRKSFENLQKWVDLITEHANEDTALMVLANKADMSDGRVVDPALGQQFASEHKIPFYETSAKEAENIDQAFLKLTSLVLQRHKVEYNAIRLDRLDSDGAEYVSELLREPTSKSNCCVLS